MSGHDHDRTAETSKRQATRSRFHWSYEEQYDGVIEWTDQICTDLTTGKIVVRYDLGDPANYVSHYGGYSRREWLERAGFDPDERIPA